MLGVFDKLPGTIAVPGLCILLEFLIAAWLIGPSGVNRKYFDGGSVEAD